MPVYVDGKVERRDCLVKGEGTLPLGGWFLAIVEAIEEVAGRQAEPGLVVPRLIGGFTDAHWFRELGITSYGFVPRALTADELAACYALALPGHPVPEMLPLG